MLMAHLTSSTSRRYSLKEPVKSEVAAPNRKDAAILAPLVVELKGNNRGKTWF